MPVTRFDIGLRIDNHNTVFDTVYGLRISNKQKLSKSYVAGVAIISLKDSPTPPPTVEYIKAT
jgi:hypothetical protein